MEVRDMKKLWPLLLLPALSLALLLPACRIGSGFDTAEKRRSLMWADEDTVQTASQDPQAKEDLPAVAALGPPIIYLLVAG
jgi:hypothetical protein